MELGIEALTSVVLDHGVASGASAAATAEAAIEGPSHHMARIEHV